jgi:glycosyltransferase involved in cell wall biosynthesis
LAKKFRILFVTTASLSTNPRIFKELHALSKSYHCIFLGFQLGTSYDQLETQRQTDLPNSVKYRYISATRTPLLNWIYSSLIKMVSKALLFALKNDLKLIAFASNKRAILLNMYIKKLTGVDLVIAHNLGSLYPAYQYSNRLNIPFIFDVEDFHPGEYIGSDAKKERQRREILMKELLLKAAAITYASPLIGEYTLGLVGSEKIKKHLLINNSFFSNEFIEAKSNNRINQSSDHPKIDRSQKLKFVWFSQYIDSGRGIEEVLPLLDAYRNQIELHLIGIARDKFRKAQLDHRDYIQLYGVLSQKDLHTKLSEFDIGLAIESSERDLNRDLCLTNKIWAYAQAGLYILATPTNSQRRFMMDFPWVGKIIENPSYDINKLISNLSTIRSQKNERYRMAKMMSFEQDEKKLLSMISDLL